METKRGISPDEALKIRNLALKIAFEISGACGPYQISSIDGKKEENRIIRGFDGPKAVTIIQESIWDYVTRGY